MLYLNTDLSPKDPEEGREKKMPAGGMTKNTKLDHIKKVTGGKREKIKVDLNNFFDFQKLSDANLFADGVSPQNVVSTPASSS